jgi:predicted DNA-binding transcriptional regulator YafY
MATDRVDQLERVTNLLALLLETRRPITLAQIVTELRGQYPPGESAQRAAFERDKALLRSEGVPIETETLGGDQAGQMGYWIDRSRYELGDLGLTDDERRALQMAVAAVHLGTTWGEEALWKVGTVDGAADQGGVAALLPSLPALAPLYDAVANRCEVGFTYHGEARTLWPFGLLGREGNWYVVGLDVGRGEQRTYRVDRIEGDVHVAQPGAFERPDGFDVRTAFPADAKLIGGDPVEDRRAVVRVSAARSASVVGELGDDAVVRRHADGSVEVSVPCANRPAFRSWALGLVEHAEVLGPPEERADIVQWLESIVAGAGEGARSVR